MHIFGLMTTLLKGLFSNPFGEVTIKINSTGLERKLKLKIYNSLGSTIQNVNITNQKTSINNLTQGIYFYSILSESSMQQQGMLVIY